MPTRSRHETNDPHRTVSGDNSPNVLGSPDTTGEARNGSPDREIDPRRLDESNETGTILKEEQETRPRAEDRTELIQPSGEQAADATVASDMGDRGGSAEFRLQPPTQISTRAVVPGDAIDRYTDWQPIGEGGFGVVYRARDNGSTRPRVAAGATGAPAAGSPHNA